MTRYRATKIVLITSFFITGISTYSQEKLTESNVEKLQTLLNQLAITTERPMLKMHFESVLKVVQDKTHQIPWTEQDTLWAGESLKFFQTAGASWETYKEGPRPLIMSFTSPSDGKTSFYWLFLPKNFSTSDEHHAFYLELHGSGGGKNDNPRNMLFRSLRPEVKGVTAQGYRKEGFFIYPWGRGDKWYQGQAKQDILECLDHFDSLFKTDPNRQYLYGFSMGGFGVLNLARSIPDRWSALGIYSGAFREGVSEKAAMDIGHLPVWLTWGEKEKLALGNKQLRDHLITNGSEVKWQEVKDVGHSYLGDYQEDLMNWFQEHDKSDRH